MDVREHISDFTDTEILYPVTKTATSISSVQLHWLWCHGYMLLSCFLLSPYCLIIHQLDQQEKDMTSNSSEYIICITNNNVMLGKGTGKSTRSSSATLSLFQHPRSDSFLSPHLYTQHNPPYTSTLSNKSATHLQLAA